MSITTKLIAKNYIKNIRIPFIFGFITGYFFNNLFNNKKLLNYEQELFNYKQELFNYKQELFQIKSNVDNHEEELSTYKLFINSKNNLNDEYLNFRYNLCKKKIVLENIQPSG